MGCFSKQTYHCKAKQGAGHQPTAKKKSGFVIIIIITSSKS